MEVVQVLVSELKHASYNPRKITPEDFDQIKTSISKYGFVQPLVCNKASGREGIIIGGNQRFEVAKKMGMTEVPVYWVDIPDIAREKELNIRLNKAQGEFDWTLLQQNFDIPNLTDWGFDLKEININFDIPDKEESQDVPELPKEPRSKRGEVYILGKHRLMCGDSKEKDQVSFLMNDQKGILFCTDPPYGVDYGDIANSRLRSQGDKKDYAQQPYKNIENDDLMGEDLQDFLTIVFKTWAQFLFDNAAWYLWHAQKTQGFFTAAAAAADVIYHRQIVWVKPQLILGRGDYHWKHELCLYGWKQGNRPPWYAGRDQHTIWEIKRENDRIHPTQKPVEIFERPLLNHTMLGEICVDPFSGSGTQFIAAEKTGRICYGMEIDPGYCDVIIKRFCNFTGANEDEIYRTAIQISTVQVVSENSAK